MGTAELLKRMKEPPVQLRRPAPSLFPLILRVLLFPSAVSAGPRLRRRARGRRRSRSRRRRRPSTSATGFLLLKRPESTAISLDFNNGRLHRRVLQQNPITPKLPTRLISKNPRNWRKMFYLIQGGRI